MKAVVLLSAVFCIAAAVFAVSSRIKTRRIIRRMHGMLDDAIAGSFAESRFDESEMSALESRLWQYLSSSEISAKRAAQERDKIKTLIADISHQTKTPIANIQLYSELLAEQKLSPEASEYAGKISAQSEKLGFLITSLVKLSRLETGIIALQPQKTPVGPMLKDIVSEYAGKASEKGLRLALQETDAEAFFDEKWTAEAVGNIVDNAIKYTESGHVGISVREYGMFVCIEVEDTGIGIPEEEQPRIFSRFYRLESAAQTSGVGIGLYLAREIIAGQNGYIKVKSEPGKGSVFSVFLSGIFQNC